MRWLIGPALCIPLLVEMWLLVEVVVWNIGPGAARVTAAQVQASTGEAFRWHAFAVPSASAQTTQSFQLELRPDDWG